MGPGTLVSLGDNAARRGALVSPSAIPCSLFHLISCTHLSLFSQTGVLPRHARCVLSRLHCNEHSLLFSFYIFRIGRIENLFCSACRHSSQDTSHFILHCPATDYLRHSLFGDSLFLFYNLQSRPCGVVRLLVPHGLPLFPIPKNGSITTTTTTNVKRTLPRLNHPTLQCRSTSCYALSIFSSKDQNCLCVVAECATRKLSLFVTVDITS